MQLPTPLQSRTTAPCGCRGWFLRIPRENVGLIAYCTRSLRMGWVITTVRTMMTATTTRLAIPILRCDTGSAVEEDTTPFYGLPQLVLVLEFCVPPSWFAGPPRRP